MAGQPRLKPEDINRLAATVLKLAQEIWVVKDRQIILERILDDNGIDASAAAQRYQPDDALRESMDAQRASYIDGILRTLTDGR